jgi:hypothetical protein
MVSYQQCFINQITKFQFQSKLQKSLTRNKRLLLLLHLKVHLAFQQVSFDVLIQRPDREQKTFGSAQRNCTFEMKQKIKRVTAFKDELSPVSRTIFLHLRSLTLIFSTKF